MGSMIVAALTAALDQWSKYRFEEKIGKDCCMPVFNDRIRLQYLENEGAFMGRFKDDKKKLMLWNAAGIGIILVMLAFSRNRLLRFGLALMLGGAIGNNIDRVRKGSVTDFITFGPKFKIHYNIADFAIFAGSFLALLGELAKRKG